MNKEQELEILLRCARRDLMKLIDTVLYLQAVPNGSCDEIKSSQDTIEQINEVLNENTPAY